MDEALRNAWTAETHKYPSIVKDVLQAALAKAQEVRRSQQQAGIRDEVIERLQEAIRPGGVANAELITEIAEWRQES